MSTPERQKTFDLIYPISHKGEDFTEITLRRPKMADVKKLAIDKGDELSGAYQMLADLSGKPVPLIEELDPEDYKPMQEWAQDILGKLSQK